MARFLLDLLQASEPQFSTAVHKLEKATGHAGVDIQLVGDIMKRAHALMRTIGLDPADTTAHELYESLRAHGKNRELFADTAFVGLVINGDAISFNAEDVEANRALPYAQRTLQAMQDALEQELIDRYHEHPRTDSRVVAEFARDAGLRYTGGQHTSTQTEAKTKPSMDRPYILSIGDIFTDAFIKLNENEAKVVKDEDGTEWLSVKFGEKMPYDQVDLVRSVGPSPNASVSFSRLGLRSGLMTYLGDDEVGKESIAYLVEQGVDTSTIVPEKGGKSSYWYVLRYGADRTMLVKNEDYLYEWREPSEEPAWIYLSQISPNAWGLHEILLRYLEAHPAVKLAFQPGTSHLRWGAEKLRDIYGRSHIVIMNREEAMDVTGKSHDSVRDLANALHELGPKIVVITDGPNGSYASYDWKVVTIPNYPDPAPPSDRTGAGDAFASTIVAALALGNDMDTALTWAPINSMSVVQKLGAQAGLLRREEVNRYLHIAPSDYKVRELE